MSKKLTAQEIIQWHCASCEDVFNFEDLVSDPLYQWDLICESCQHKRGKMTKKEADYLIAEGVALKHNLHTENPSKKQILSAMGEYAQSRLQAIAEEVEGLYGDAMAPHHTPEYGYNEAIESVLQIIQQHLEDDNLD